ELSETLLKNISSSHDNEVTTTTNADPQFLTVSSYDDQNPT
ncbi:6335_t:CDS:1, partial [Gigaspora margarita]